MQKLIILLLIPTQLAVAQDKILLEDCYKLAKENYPKLKNAEIWQKISSLKKENIKTGYLPKIEVKGQATYQSDVINIDIPVPEASIPAVPKDQYKAYAEINQTIWDGGLTKVNTQLEEALLKDNLNQLEVELYKLKEQVAQAFFTALAMEKQKAVLEAQKTVLKEKLETVRSGIENQVIEKTESFAMEAEILTLEQKVIQVQTGKSAALKILSLLTDKDIPDNSKLEFQEPSVTYGSNILRPELQLFSGKISHLETQMEVLEKSRNPKIFGFGQAGYGKPGLNMLNDEFDTYYLMGIGLSWSPFDWQKTTRQKQVLQLQQQMIRHEQETFSQNIKILLSQQKEQINKLEKQLEKDKNIIDLKTKIVKAAESKLENGTITSSDYISEMQAETIAKLNHELNKILLHEAREKYEIILGTDNKNGLDENSERETQIKEE